MNAVEIEDKTEELLACLDKDAQHIEQSLSQLNELRTLVIKRDDAALGKLLESIQAEAAQRRSQERQRQSVREDLAKALGCDVKQMTLSLLLERLAEAEKSVGCANSVSPLGVPDGIAHAAQARVCNKLHTLRNLVAELRKEYASTMLLVSECSRLNNLLLRSIFNPGAAGQVTYDASGASRRQTETAFVNLQL